MVFKKYLFVLLLFVIPACQGEDTTGKIIIEYDNDWTAVITSGYTETTVSGTGMQEFVYENPDYLEISASKLDGSLEKITVYIYEDDRIVAGESTRDAQGTVTAFYEYPY
ncbi:MAG: hypothetical protein JW864_04880 [Spirochaetes bacterium]|nr:hypothetical protein [Spirochaetota bacterium]